METKDLDLTEHVFLYSKSENNPFSVIYDPKCFSGCLQKAMEYTKEEEIYMQSLSFLPLNEVERSGMYLGAIADKTRLGIIMVKNNSGLINVYLLKHSRCDLFYVAYKRHVFVCKFNLQSRYEYYSLKSAHRDSAARAPFALDLWVKGWGDLFKEVSQGLLKTVDNELTKLTKENAFANKHYTAFKKDTSTNLSKCIEVLEEVKRASEPHIQAGLKKYEEEHLPQLKNIKKQVEQIMELPRSNPYQYKRNHPVVSAVKMYNPDAEVPWHLTEEIDECEMDKQDYKYPPKWRNVPYGVSLKFWDCQVASFGENVGGVIIKCLPDYAIKEQLASNEEKEAIPVKDEDDLEVEEVLFDLDPKSDLLTYKSSELVTAATAVKFQVPAKWHFRTVPKIDFEYQLEKETFSWVNYLNRKEHDHAFLAHPRVALEHYFCSVFKGKLLDIGGDMNRHAMYRHTNVWSCAPDLIPGDKGRHALANAKGLLQWCKHKVTECDCIVPDAYLSVHSLYYLSVDEIKKLALLRPIYFIIHLFGPGIEEIPETKVYYEGEYVQMLAKLNNYQYSHINPTLTLHRLLSVGVKVQYYGVVDNHYFGVIWTSQSEYCLKHLVHYQMFDTTN